jgi:protein-disulfide isomerase
VDEYKGEVAWVYRHYPLDSLHPQAREEALATECAAEQKGTDGFWALTDKIYEVTPSNNGLNLADLPKLAGQVGLDGTKLQTCIDSGKYKDIVEAQYQGGVTAGVTGTPGNFVINDKGEAWLIPGAVPFTTLKQTLDEALGKS